MNIRDNVASRVGQIYAEAIRLTLAALPVTLIYLIVLTAGGVAVDQMVDFEAASLALSILMVALGYWLTVSMLREGGLAPNGLRSGFGTYFVLSFVSGIAIMLGLVVLIVPGLFLLVRWLPVYGYGLVEGEGAIEALGTSWNETEGHALPIFITVLAPSALWSLALVIYAIALDEYEIVEIVPSIAANLAFTIAGVTITAMGLAAYSLLRSSVGGLKEVFE